jgi:carbamoyl-phosphate synthase large subunit
LKRHGVPTERVYKVSQKKGPNALDLIARRKVGFVVNVSDLDSRSSKDRAHRTDGYEIRRGAVDANIPLFTDISLAKAFARARAAYKLDDVAITSWQEYVGLR